MKGIEARRVKHPAPSRATDALIGDEEQNGKEKRTKRKKEGADPQPRYSEPFSRLLRPQGSYGEPILVTLPQAHTGKKFTKQNELFLWLLGMYYYYVRSLYR